jgi:Tfp pilus assembly PilM family ATPase
METVVVGLIKGRHEMPVPSYIFEEDIKDMFNYYEIRKHISDFIHDKVGVDYYHLGQYHSNRGKKHLTVYVTGLTSVVCELVDVCNKAGVLLTLMHYDRYTGSYRPQYLGVKESIWHQIDC